MTAVRTGICSICSRADAAVIDHELARSGVSWRAVARKFNIGRSAIARHADKHLGGRLRRAAETRAAGSDPELLDRLSELNRHALEILSAAFASKNYGAAIKAVGEARAQLELEAKLLGQLSAGGTTVNVAVLDEATAERVARVYLQRRGLLPAAPAAIEVEAEEPEEEGS